MKMPWGSSPISSRLTFPLIPIFSFCLFWERVFLLLLWIILVWKWCDEVLSTTSFITFYISYVLVPVKRKWNYLFNVFSLSIFLCVRVRRKRNCSHCVYILLMWMRTYTWEENETIAHARLWRKWKKMLISKP